MDMDIRGLVNMISDIEAQPDASNANDEINDFVNYTIFLESQSHHWHLQTHKFSDHIALNGFYEEFPDLVDSFVEAYMAHAGTIVPSECEYRFTPVQEAVKCLQLYRDRASQVHQSLEPVGLGITNTLEDIITACDSVLYKLTNLTQ